MDDDSTLLRRYAETRCEDAFSELVRRHLDFVHSVALRHTRGDAHLAQDVSQQVFLALARHAAALARHPSLLGWLHTCACRRAADLVRAEARRRTRETVASTDAALAPEPPISWETLAPELDLALQTIGTRDRETILLRYFANQSFAALAAALGTTEAAAQMRAARALEKLRRALAKRGVTSTASALGLALGANAVTAAPASVAASILATLTTSAAVATAATSATSLTLLTTMTTSTKLTLGVIMTLLGTLGVFIAGRDQPPAAPHASPESSHNPPTLSPSPASATLTPPLPVAPTAKPNAPARTASLFATPGDAALYIAKLNHRSLALSSIEAAPGTAEDIRRRLETEDLANEFNKILRDPLLVSLLSSRHPETLADFQAAYVSATLALDDARQARLRTLLLAAYQEAAEQTLFQSQRPPGDTTRWEAARLDLNLRTSAKINPLLLPDEQRRFQRFGYERMILQLQFGVR
jgi:RNA polymerase sigma factor (sigma-70 family)